MPERDSPGCLRLTTTARAAVATVDAQPPPIAVRWPTQSFDRAAVRLGRQPLLARATTGSRRAPLWGIGRQRRGDQRCEPSGGVESIARQGALGLAQDAERASVEAEPLGKALGLLRGQAGEGVAIDDQLCSC
jgi:hypothetical protein